MSESISEIMTRKWEQRERRAETCSKHGAFESVRYPAEKDYFGVMREEWWTECPTCREEWALEESRRTREKELAWRINLAHIPPRFLSKTLSNYEPSCDGERRALAVARDYAEHFNEHRADGSSLTLIGKPGTGKTHLACAIGTELIRSDYRVLYTTVQDLIRRIRATWNHDSEASEEVVLMTFRAPDLLIIDEIGVQFGTEAEIAQLTEIIDIRYRCGKPTLAVSNCSLRDLPKYLGDRGLDRLRENGGKIVPFNWPSYRGR